MAFGKWNDENQAGYTSTTRGAGVVETTLWDANLPRVDKRVESIELETRNIGTGGRTIKVEYRADQNEAYTVLGTAGVAQQSPFYILKFPSSTVAKPLQQWYTGPLNNRQIIARQECTMQAHTPPPSAQLDIHPRLPAHRSPCTAIHRFSDICTSRPRVRLC